MGTVEFVVTLEQQMELVPLRRGWWVAFGGPRQPKPASFREQPLLSAEAAEDSEPARAGDAGEVRSRRRRAGAVPPEPRRRSRRQPQLSTPRPMPDPAPSPVPEPPAADIPEAPRSGRRRR